MKAMLDMLALACGIAVGLACLVVAIAASIVGVFVLFALAKLHPLLSLGAIIGVTWAVQRWNATHYPTGPYGRR